MPNHTVVAVYETAAQAAAAVRDLQAAHILPDAISQHTKTLTASGTAHSAPREQGFWASLFGSEHDTSVYDRSVEEGASVLTVRVPDDGVDRVTSILESHNPIDLDERAAQYTAEGGTRQRGFKQPPGFGRRHDPAGRREPGGRQAGGQRRYDPCPALRRGNTGRGAGHPAGRKGRDRSPPRHGRAACRRIHRQDHRDDGNTRRARRFQDCARDGGSEPAQGSDGSRRDGAGYRATRRGRS